MCHSCVFTHQHVVALARLSCYMKSDSSYREANLWRLGPGVVRSSSSSVAGRSTRWVQGHHFADRAKLLPIQQHHWLAASAQPACTLPNINTVQVACCYQVKAPSSWCAGQAVLCCAVLSCAELCCAVLCCAVLCCAVPCCRKVCCGFEADNTTSLRKVVYTAKLTKQNCVYLFQLRGVPKTLVRM